MKKSNGTLALLAAFAFVAPSARAQGQGAAAQNPLQAAYSEAKNKLMQDKRAYRTAMRAEKEACKTPGAACDEAKAKSKPLSDALTADTKEVQKACAALDAAGQPNPCKHAPPKTGK